MTGEGHRLVEEEKRQEIDKLEIPTMDDSKEYASCVCFSVPVHACTI